MPELQLSLSIFLCAFSQAVRIFATPLLLFIDSLDAAMSTIAVSLLECSLAFYRASTMH